MKVIGITGGVGAGKSEVLELIRELCDDGESFGKEDAKHCYILKADDAAKEIEKKGQAAYEPLKELLSEDILKEDGEIDSRKMAGKIFKDPSLREKVNDIVHPLVKTYILSEIDEKKKDGKYDLFFIEAALLIEEGYDSICDELWYVYADEDIRKERLESSRGYSREKTESIMRAQNTDEVFRRYCKLVIDNSGDIDLTREQLVKALSKN